MTIGDTRYEVRWTENHQRMLKTFDSLEYAEEFSKSNRNSTIQKIIFEDDGLGDEFSQYWRYVGGVL